MTDRPRLFGKIALVTGAARGIGEGIARNFAKHGARVVVTDINTEQGQATVQAIGSAAVFEPLDVRSVEAWSACVSNVVQRFGGIDILVNNAGGGAGGPIEIEAPEEHRRILELNITGVWNGMRSLLRTMTSRGGGSIVNISSIDGLVGVSGLTTYVATKFAVTGMTRALALEVGPQGIRVNSVHPGITRTPLVEKTRPAVMQRLEKAIARQPIARMGTVDEVANAVLFFASDESSYCTGTSLVVDGGHLAGPYRDPL